MVELPDDSLAPTRHGLTLLALAAAALAGIAFGVGAGGPFVLDDAVNLAPLLAWASGQAGLWETAFGGSGPTGRPLAYLSLMANLAGGGVDPLGFKLANIALHIAAGGMAFLVLGRLARSSAVTHPIPTPGQAPQLRFGAATVALALTCLWLLHPQHVSTVLYVVQRMALLGAIAQLAGVLVFLRARELLPERPAQAAQMLFLLFPLVLVAGSMAKETALLAPALCLAVHLAFPSAWSSAAGEQSRPRTMLRAFFGVFLVLPLLAGAAFLAMRPGWLVEGYAAREFDLAERLLTQPRILLDYAAGWFWPAQGQFALFRDGYPHSSGWLQPASTLASALLVAASLVGALWLRARSPWVAAGVLWFLAAHALESTVLGLEPYFEHRNYVASLGLVMLAYGMVEPLLARIRGRALAAGLFAILMALSASTAWRAWHWGTPEQLLATEGPPGKEISRRLQVDRAILAFQQDDPEGVAAALDLLASGNPGDAAAAALWAAIFACDGEGSVSDDLLQNLLHQAPPVITHSHVSWLEILARRAGNQRCDGLQPIDIDGIVVKWQAQARKPVTTANRHRLDALRQVAAEGSGK